MNHEQWEALNAETKYHARGPWGHELFSDIFVKSDNRILAAAAPDLLAEVERLRGWVAHVHKSTPWDITVRDLCQKALDDAEVPE